MRLLDASRDNGVLTLRLDDPSRSNLLSAELCAALIEQVKRADSDPELRAIVLRASGKAFCAGADLEDLKAAAAGDPSRVESVYDAFLSVANSSLPTLAVVEGAAVGAGMNLALACDMRIAGERAMFDTRFLQIGLHPGGGHAWMLLRAVRWQQACELLLLGKVLDAESAARIGLVNAVHAPNALEDALQAMLARIRNTPRELLRRTKATMRLAAGQEHDAAYRHETAEQMWSLGQPAFADLVNRLQRKLAAKQES